MYLQMVKGLGGCEYLGVGVLCEETAPDVHPSVVAGRGSAPQQPHRSVSHCSAKIGPLTLPTKPYHSPKFPLLRNRLDPHLQN